MTSLYFINYYFRILCIIGLLLAAYSLLVEVKIEEDEHYVAMCDISEHMSCTKAFSSEYGKGFGILGEIFGKDSILNAPNSIAGILFYSLCFIISYSDSHLPASSLLYITFFSNLMSIYLAYILYFILHDFCIVCVSTYVVNILLTYLAYKKASLVTRKSGRHLFEKNQDQKKIL